MSLVLVPAVSAEVSAEQASAELASAEQVSAEVQAPATEVAASVQHSQALRVYKDPATGRLVAPPREVREALAAADKQRMDLNQSSEGLQARVHRNGMVTMDLQGRFQSHYFVTRGEDGQLEHRCSDGELAFIEQLIANYRAQQNAEQEVPNDR